MLRPDSQRRSRAAWAAIEQAGGLARIYGAVELAPNRNFDPDYENFIWASCATIANVAGRRRLQETLRGFQSLSHARERAIWPKLRRNKASARAVGTYLRRACTEVHQGSVGRADADQRQTL